MEIALAQSSDARKRRISETTDTPGGPASSPDDSINAKKRRQTERRDSMLIVLPDQPQPADDPTELSIFTLDPMDDSLVTTRFSTSGLSTNVRTEYDGDGTTLTLKVVMEPFRYLSCLPSKGVRNKVVDALNYWFEAPSYAVEVVKSVTNLLHSSSLM